MKSRTAKAKPSSNGGRKNKSSASSSSFSKIKVINATSALIAGAPLATYPFECVLDTDFLTNLSLRVSPAGKSGLGDITDDLKLESYFMQQALASVVSGRSRLEACGRTFNRPPTYHAHLLKTVAHLQRINRAEEADRKQREAISDARRQRLLKSTAKKVQQDTLMDRQKTRTEDRKKIEIIKKAAGGGKDQNDNDFNVETVLEDVLSNNNNSKKNNNNNLNTKNKKTLPVLKKNNSNRFNAGLANSKRQSKDKKFGFGGLDRKMTKRNTKESVNDLSDFAKSNSKAPFGGRVQKKVKGGRPAAANKKFSGRSGRR